MLFRNEDHHLELRVRSIVELAKNSFFYLAEDEVTAGMEAAMAILNGKAVPEFLFSYIRSTRRKL